jgi:tripartite ATP-independent transporter DctM subunit
MDPLVIGVIGIVTFLFLLIIGVPVAVSMFVVGIAGCVIMLGPGSGLYLLGTTPYAISSTYQYVCLPLFLLMGSFALYGGFGKGAYEALYRLVSKLPGGLAIATTLACGAFGAASGSSVAAAAIFARVSLPEMLKYRYDTRLALGCVAAAGTFATMIPPSINLIVYGMFTDASIVRLFMAGILPGLFTVLVYSLSIIIRVRRNPQLAPRLAGEAFTLKERLLALPMMWPIIVLALLIIGGTYLGWFTATEAGGAGALAAFLIAVVQKGFKGARLPEALLETAKTCAMIFAILVGSILFSRFIALSRIPAELAAFLAGLPVARVLILSAFLAMYFLLGMVVSALGMLAITLPIVAPVLEALGYDLIWFGIIAIKMCEIAVVTPPVGLNVYVVKGVVGEDASLEQIFAGIYPFVVCDIVVLAFLISFPQIALFLPNLLF